MADLRSVLTGYYGQYGQLTPEIVVEESRPETAPLHHRFEWNDGVAAELYRREQAGDLIREVLVTFGTTPTGEPQTVRAFQSLHRAGSERKGYIPVEEVVQDEMATKILLNELKREMLNVQRRYGHLEEYARILREAAQAS